MSFPRYPKYKDSGVNWLGEIPAHWEVKKLKYVSSELTVGIVIEPSRLYAEEGVSALRSLNVKAGAISLDNLVFITQAGHELHSKSRLRAGDIVAVRTGQPGTAAVVPQELDGCNCIDLIVIRRPAAGSERFLCWYLGSNSALAQFSVGSDGAIQQHFNISTAAELIIAVPPPADQFRIAAFLDRETAKLDALMTEQQQLIDLLEEKRQAVISHAVTRGLNPDVPLKPSGVEWLGDVPTHWEVSPLKYFARVGNGSTPSREQPAYWMEGTYPWLNSSVVNQETITKSDQFVTELALRECHLPKIVPPAVLVGITGQGRTRGMASTLMIEATISQHIAYVQPDSSKASVGWVRRVIDANYKLLRDESEAGGSTKGAITCEQISALKFPLPPPSEQAAILASLEKVLGNIDTLTVEARRAIDLLQERRAALISAAVTGQIDVRGIAERSAA